MEILPYEPSAASELAMVYNRAVEPVGVRCQAKVRGDDGLAASAIPATASTAVSRTTSSEVRLRITHLLPRPPRLKHLG